VLAERWQSGRMCPTSILATSSISNKLVAWIIVDNLIIKFDMIFFSMPRGLLFTCITCLLVTRVQSAVLDIELSKATVAEEKASGTIVGVFTATLSDGNSSLFYELVDGNGSEHNHFFAVDENGTLLTAATLDYEANAALSIRVRASDDGSDTLEKVFIVQVENLELRIIQAIYGTEKIKVDVRNFIEGMISGDAVNHRIGNSEMGGDPDSGTVKTLWLKYEWGGEISSTSVREGGTLEIPKIETGSIFVPFMGSARIIHEVIYRQTDANGSSPDELNPFGYRAGVRDVFPGQTQSLLLPLTSSYLPNPLVGFEDKGNRHVFSRRYGTFNQLVSDFPEGDYAWTVRSSDIMEKFSGTIPVDHNAFPSVKPEIQFGTWENGRLLLRKSSPRLYLSPWNHPAAASHIEVVLIGADGRELSRSINDSDETEIRLMDQAEGTVCSVVVSYLLENHKVTTTLASGDFFDANFGHAVSLNFDAEFVSKSIPSPPSERSSLSPNSEFFYEMVYRQADANGSSPDELNPFGYKAGVRDVFPGQTQSLLLPLNSSYSPNPLIGFEDKGNRHVFSRRYGTFNQLVSDFPEGDYAWTVRSSDTMEKFSGTIPVAYNAFPTVKPEIQFGTWENGRLLLRKSSPRLYLSAWNHPAATSRIEVVLFGADGRELFRSINDSDETEIRLMDQAEGTVSSAVLSYLVENQKVEGAFASGETCKARFGHAVSLYFEVEFVSKSIPSPPSERSSLSPNSEFFYEMVYRQADANGSSPDELNPFGYKAGVRDVFPGQTQSLLLPLNSSYSPNPLVGFEDKGNRHVFSRRYGTLNQLVSDFPAGDYAWAVRSSDTMEKFSGTIPVAYNAFPTVKPEIHYGTWENGRLLLHKSNPRFRIAPLESPHSTHRIEVVLLASDGRELFRSINDSDETEIRLMDQAEGTVSSVVVSYLVENHKVEGEFASGETCKARFGHAASLYFEVEFVSKSIPSPPRIRSSNGNDTDIFFEKMYQQSDSSGASQVNPALFEFRARARNNFSDQNQSILCPATASPASEYVTDFVRIGAHHVFSQQYGSVNQLLSNFPSGEYVWSIDGSKPFEDISHKIPVAFDSFLDIKPEIIDGTWTDGRLLLNAASPYFRIAPWANAPQGSRIEFEYWGNGGSGSSSRGSGSSAISFSPRPVGSIHSACLSYRAVNHEEEERSGSGDAYNARFGHAATLYFEIEFGPNSLDPSKRLRIVEARFGSKDRYTDVTAILQGKVHGDTLSMDVNRWSLRDSNDPSGQEPGDPFGENLLTVTYDIGVSRHRLIIPENERLSIHSAQPIILEAYFGSEHDKFDVTGVLQGKVSGKSLPIRIRISSWDFRDAGNPFGNFPRGPLTVTYQFEDLINKVVVHEHEELYISNDQLRIVEAYWSSQNGKVDVTAILQGKVTGQSLRCHVDSHSLSDPNNSFWWSPWDSRLVVIYESNGGRYLTMVKEHDELEIPKPSDYKIDLSDSDILKDPAKFSLISIVAHNAEVVSREVMAFDRGGEDAVSFPGKYDLLSMAELNASLEQARAMVIAEVVGSPTLHGLIGIAEANATALAAKRSGRQEVLDAPRAFGLHPPSDLNASEVEAILQGRNEVVDHPHAYGLFTELDLNSTILLGRADAIASVLKSPGSYDLMTLADANATAVAAKLIGRSEVVRNPRSYGLWGDGDLNASLSKAQAIGISTVLSQPKSYGLLTTLEANASVASAKLEGRGEVLGAPSAFGLYRASDLNASTVDAFSQGKNEVIASPRIYGLYSKKELNDALAESRLKGINNVKESPSTFGLVSQADLNKTISDMAEVHDKELVQLAKQAKADGIASVKANPAQYGLAHVEVMKAIGATPHTHDWYYQPEWGWVWTNEKSFPYVYSAGGGGRSRGWLYFREGSADPIYYYSYAEEKWITLGKKLTEKEMLQSIFD
jgi:hypothetical protein